MKQRPFFFQNQIRGLSSDRHLLTPSSMCPWAWKRICPKGQLFFFFFVGDLTRSASSCRNTMSYVQHLLSLTCEETRSTYDLSFSLAASVLVYWPKVLAYPRKKGVVWIVSQMKQPSQSFVASTRRRSRLVRRPQVQRESPLEQL